MSEELRSAFGVFMEALDKELFKKDDHISFLEGHVYDLERENNQLKQNLRNTADIFASAAQALQKGF